MIRRWALDGPGSLLVAMMRVPLAGTVMLAPFASVAHAQEQRLRFDVPAQDLASALQAFARQAGVQILFPYEIAAGRHSARLRGTMSLLKALDRLIAAHGLRVVAMSGQRITLGPANRPVTGPAVARQPAHARSRPPRAPAAPPAPAPAIEGTESIIVTGRAASSPLTRAAYSYAVSSIDWSGQDHRGPVSVAEMFRAVPGLWVESSGGEGSNNVRSRGIPTDGFTSVALVENGIPVQYDGGLGYLNTDQSFRLDETVARIEVVRGGPSSLFTPNAPGGVANIITRSALRDPGGLAKATLGDHGYARLDVVEGIRLSDSWGLLAGGFYRRDGGRRRPGFTADEGGQGRVALDFDDGVNSLSLDLRHLDDRVAFYLPVPLRFDDRGRVAAIAGFDPLRDSLSGPETLRLALKGADGTTPFDLTQGTRSHVTALTLRGRFHPADHVEVATALRWRTSDILRNALFPVGVPMPGADYLASIGAATLAAFPAATRLALRYAADGAPVPADANGNGLVVGANLLTVRVPLEEFIADQRIVWQFDQGGRHNLAIGGTLARYAYRFDRDMGTVLLDVRNGARLIDAVALDAAGSVVGSYTDHGLQRHGSVFDRADVDVAAAAAYLADEWQIARRWRLDIGGRWERSRVATRAADRATFDLGNSFTLADNQVLGPSGAIIAARQAFSAVGWSAGVSYTIGRQAGLFARYTATFRLPSASEFNMNPLRTDQAVVPIRLAEAGATYAGRRYSVAATAFYTRFDRLPFTDFRFDPASNGYAERTAIAGSQTAGVELEARLHPVRAFELKVEATWQAPRYRDFAFVDLVNGAPVRKDYTGNQLIRVPRLAIRATPAIDLFDGRLHAELSIARYSRRFSDIANTQVLPAYTLIGVDAAARLTDRLRLSLNASNLANTLGLTEGNPRTGSFETGTAIRTYFLARPEFARSVRIALAFNLGGARTATGLAR